MNLAISSKIFMKHGSVSLELIRNAMKWIRLTTENCNEAGGDMTVTPSFMENVKYMKNAWNKHACLGACCIKK